MVIYIYFIEKGQVMSGFTCIILFVYVFKVFLLPQYWVILICHDYVFRCLYYTVLLGKITVKISAFYLYR